MSHKVLVSVPPKRHSEVKSLPESFHSVESCAVSEKPVWAPHVFVTDGGGSSQRGGSCFGKGGVQGGASRLGEVFCCKCLRADLRTG